MSAIVGIPNEDKSGFFNAAIQYLFHSREFVEMLDELKIPSTHADIYQELIWLLKSLKSKDVIKTTTLWTLISKLNSKACPIKQKGSAGGVVNLIVSTLLAGLNEKDKDKVRTLLTCSGNGEFVSIEMNALLASFENFEKG